MLRGTSSAKMRRWPLASKVTSYWLGWPASAMSMRLSPAGARPFAPRRVQVAPSKSPSTTPRQYSCSCGGIGVEKRAVKTGSPDRASVAMAPGCMLSDRPERACVPSCGAPHRGPSGRGTTKNSSAARGAASASMRPSRRSRCGKRGCTAPYWADSRPASSTSTVASIQAALRMSCAWKKLASSKKKLRKTKTKISRRPCISSDFRASSRASMATPGSRPSKLP